MKRDSLSFIAKWERFMAEVKGYVEHIVFRNEENGYTVFNLRMKTEN